MATLLIPHEYLPLPPVDTRVALADRTGHRIGEGRVLRHARPLRDDPTVVLHIETSPDLAEQACGLYLQNSPDRATQDVGVDIGSIAGDTTSGSVAYASGDDRIICRCENTNLGSIKQAILSGARTLDEVKRRTRSGMGLCGGRNCGKLIAGIMADMLADDGGYRALPVQPLRVRPPVVPVSVAELAEVKPGSNQMTDLGPTR
jgi:bacterioferritin-associated ferredoxin